MVYMNEFQQALADGDTRTVKRMLRFNPALREEPNSFGSRPLMQAVMGLDRTLGCVRTLLDAGAEVNARTPEGYTALHFAVDFMGQLGPATEPSQFIRLLVKAGADLEARQHWGWTPLMRAVLEGTAEEVEALLAAGANPNVAFPPNTLPVFMRGHTLLMTAVSDRVTLPLLLKAGADVTIKDDYGQTALEYANGLFAKATDAGYQSEVRDCIKMLQAVSTRGE